MTNRNAALFCQACIDGDLEAVELLIEADPTLVHTRGLVAPAHRDFMRREAAEGGWTPLHLAAHYGRAEIVARLLEAGADINAQAENGIGNTPLMAAIAGGKAGIVTMLLEAGADARKKDKAGLDALTLAEEKSRYDLAAIIRGEPLAEAR